MADHRSTAPAREDPYGEGWLFLVETEEDGHELLDAESYAALVGG
jgi:glycine cleavage system H lipoate-binding protein